MSHAGRQPAQAGQLLALHQGGLGLAEHPVLLGQVLLQTHDALAGPHPDAQLIHVERLGHEIVGPGLHADDHVPFLGPRGQQDDIDEARPGIGADEADQFGTVDLRHDPVADDQGKRLGLEQSPCLAPILSRDDLITPLLEMDL